MRRSLAGLIAANVAALSWQLRSEDERDRRLTRARNDVRTLREALDRIAYSWDWLRLKVPYVRDALGGLALAFAPPKSEVVPSLAQRTRPSLGDSMPTVQWPPNVGAYDSDGKPTEWGELAWAFLLLTYQEPRLVLAALTQSEEPSAGQQESLWRAFKALGQVIKHQHRTLESWKELWEDLFSTLHFTGSTEDESPIILGKIRARHDGLYRAVAICTIDDSANDYGSLLITATMRHRKDENVVLRSDRLNAQLAPALVGVDAKIVAVREGFAVVVAGKQQKKLFWEASIRLHRPLH